MATEAYDTIREPDPTLGTAGETLKQARSLALLLSTSDQCEDAARDVAVTIVEKLERAIGELMTEVLPDRFRAGRALAGLVGGEPA